MKNTYYIRINEDGTETRLPTTPEWRRAYLNIDNMDKTIIEVDLIEENGRWFEHTNLPTDPEDIMDYQEALDKGVDGLFPVSAPPPGEGWEVFDSSDDEATFWRRPVSNEIANVARQL